MPEAHRKPVTDGLKTLGADARKFIDAVKKDESLPGRAAEIDKANVDLSASIQQLAAAVRQAFQASRLSLSDDQPSSEERLRAFHKAVLDSCKRIWGNAQVPTHFPNFGSGRLFAHR